MPSHRSLRIAEAIREVVASSILFDVADPRVRAVTVLRVEVSGDLHHATVYVSVMGTPSEQQIAMTGLKHAAGFLQARVAARLQTRFTPHLTFKLDEGIKKSIEMSRLIDEALASDRRGPRTGGRPGEVAEADDPDDEADDDDGPDHSPQSARRPPAPGRTPRDPRDPLHTPAPQEHAHGITK